MAKYLMLGKYSSEGIKGISKERTKKAADTIKGAGGKIEMMYILMGRYDIVILADFPGNSEAVKASVGLSKLTGVGFTTSPAISVEEFDKMTG